LPSFLPFDRINESLLAHLFNEMIGHDPGIGAIVRFVHAFEQPAQAFHHVFGCGNLLPASGWSQTEGWNLLLDVLGSVWNPILPKGRRNFTFGRLEVPFGTQIIQIEPESSK
jgi:hypothetical protein